MEILEFDQCFILPDEGFVEIVADGKLSAKNELLERVGKAARVAFVLLLSSSLITTTLVITIAIPPTAAIVSSLAISAIGGSLADKLTQSSNVIAIHSRPATLSPKIKVDPMSETIVCDDTMESFEWKKKLIQAANENILLSGNFCGGTSFDEILHLIEENLREKIDLKVMILSSTKFLTRSNQEELQQLIVEFQERFIMIPTDDLWIISDTLKKSTNHTKALSIDYGKYFILGGSGLEDKYTLARGVGDRTTTTQSSEGSTLLKIFLPRGFRDGDVVFRSAPQRSDLLSVGEKLHEQLFRLGKLWHSYNRITHQNPTPFPSWFTPQTVVGSLGSVEIADFHNSPKKNERCQTEILSSGPEQKGGELHELILKEIRSAKDRIYIDHMYFHPTEELLRELANSTERGVQITIVTNGVEPFSPLSHSAFAPRNRYAYSRLAEMISESNRHLLSVYEYGQKYHNTPRKTTLHKKCLVIDDTVIAGSSNLGYKSLVTSSDHEINFITRSKANADQMVRTIIQDIEEERIAHNSKGEELFDHQNGEPIIVKLSQKIENPLYHKTVMNMLLAWRHVMLAPLMGYIK